MIQMETSAFFVAKKISVDNLVCFYFYLGLFCSLLSLLLLFPVS